MESENILWVQNQGTADVSLSDLGVKVPAGQTVNVYKYNPYLTVAQVEKSLESGALSKRLESKVLRIVDKKVTSNPHALNKLKESNETVLAKKTKSSVVIESKTEEPEEGGSFGFADYGISDIGPDVATTKEDGSVFVTAKQDDLDEPDQGTNRSCWSNC
jgi:hypothetical protein